MAASPSGMRTIALKMPRSRVLPPVTVYWMVPWGAAHAMPLELLALLDVLVDPVLELVVDPVLLAVLAPLPPSLLPPQPNAPVLARIAAIRANRLYPIMVTFPSSSYSDSAHGRTGARLATIGGTSYAQTRHQAPRRTSPACALGRLLRHLAPSNAAGGAPPRPNPGRAPATRVGRSV